MNSPCDAFIKARKLGYPSRLFTGPDGLMAEVKIVIIEGIGWDAPLVEFVEDVGPDLEYSAVELFDGYYYTFWEGAKNV